MNFENTPVDNHIDEAATLVEHLFSNFLHQFQDIYQGIEDPISNGFKKPLYMAQITEMLKKNKCTLYIDMLHLNEVY